MVKNKLGFRRSSESNDLMKEGSQGGYLFREAGHVLPIKIRKVHKVLKFSEVLGCCPVAMAVSSLFWYCTGIVGLSHFI